MRLGIGSYTYAWAIGVPGYPPPQSLTHFDLLNRASELGVSVVQIADNLPLEQLDEATVDNLASITRERDIQIEVGTRGIAPQNLRTYLRLAGKFGSPIVRVVVDTATHHPSVDEIVAVVRQILPEFERANVTLAIENHDRFRAATLVDIMQRVDSPKIGICLDTVNSFGALEGPATVVDTLGPWVVNLHIKDFCIQRVAHAMGFTIEGRPAGEGHLHIPWLLEQLGATKQNYSAILELWPPPESTLSATIAKEEEWARVSVSNLRKFIST